MSKFCVYLHLRKDTGKVFYIGQGTLKRSISKSGRSKLWSMQVKESGGFNVKILFSNLTKSEAVDIENKYLLNHDESWVLINSAGPSVVKEMTVDMFNDLRYNLESPSGLSWTTHGKSRKSNLVAGTKDSRGYWKVSIKDKVYQAHRIVWLLCNRSIMKESVINHIDSNTSNNNIENLEECTQAENCRRKIIHKSEKTGILLHVVNGCEYWRAQHHDIYDKLHMKNFSVKKLGYNEALEAAKLWRNSSIEELKKIGAGYK